MCSLTAEMIELHRVKICELLLGNCRYDGSFAYLCTCIERKSTCTLSFVVMPLMEYWNADECIDSMYDINLVGFYRYLWSLCESTVYNRRQSALGLVYLRLLGDSTVMFHYSSLRSDTATLSWLAIH